MTNDDAAKEPEKLVSISADYDTQAALSITMSTDLEESDGYRVGSSISVSGVPYELVERVEYEPGRVAFSLREIV